MAYRRKSRSRSGYRSTRRPVRRGYSPRRGSRSRRRTGGSRGQTVRIVIQQAPGAAVPGGISGVPGAAPAPAPKKARF